MASGARAVIGNNNNHKHRNNNNNNNNNVPPQQHRSHVALRSLNADQKDAMVAAALKAVDEATRHEEL